MLKIVLYSSVTNSIGTRNWRIDIDKLYDLIVCIFEALMRWQRLYVAEDSIVCKISWLKR